MRVFWGEWTEAGGKPSGRVGALAGISKAPPQPATVGDPPPHSPGEGAQGGFKHPVPEICPFSGAGVQRGAEQGGGGPGRAPARHPPRLPTQPGTHLASLCGLGVV